jgi:hypothetical protein
MLFSLQCLPLPTAKSFDSTSTLFKILCNHEIPETDRLAILTAIIYYYTLRYVRPVSFEKKLMKTQTLAMLVGLFFSSPASATNHSLMTCFSDGLTGELSSSISEFSDNKATAVVEGTFNSETLGAIPFRANFIIEKGDLFIINGQLEVLNPYLNVIEKIDQKSTSYNEINILKNRIRGKDGGFGLSPGDQYGFGIHCGLLL